MLGVHCFCFSSYVPWEDKIERPHLDAARTSELSLCQKQFWRDIEHFYFGAGAVDWVVAFVT